MRFFQENVEKWGKMKTKKCSCLSTRTQGEVNEYVVGKACKQWGWRG